MIKKSTRRAASAKKESRSRGERKKAPGSSRYDPQRDSKKKDFRTKDPAPSRAAPEETPDSGMVIGVNSVQALFLDAERPVEYLAVAKGAGGKRVQEIIEKAREQGLRTRFVDRQTLDGMTGGLAHQGVVARAGIRKQPSFKQLLAKINATADSLLVILDGVEDPHNLGAIIRSAESFGAVAVLLPKDRTAALSMVASKASAGAVERLDVVRVTNLTRAITELKENGVQILGLAGESEAIAIDRHSFAGATALVLGGEGKGLRRLTRDNCDALLSIPITGGVGSLNVSVAAGVALYEVQRSRGGIHVAGNNKG